MAALSTQDISELKASAKELQAKGPAIATKMYDYFFAEHPDMKFYFSTSFLGKKSNDEHGEASEMAKAMSHVLFQFTLAIDHIDKLNADLERISYKHVSRGIKPEFYPYLGDCLIKAIQEVIGDKAALLRAWRQAYDAVISMFVENEKRIAKEIKEQPGGWEGFRKFKIVSTKVEELDDVFDSEDENTDIDEDEKHIIDEEEKHKKFYYYMVPVEGETRMPELKLGQFVCVRFHTNGTTTHRNYIVEAIENNQIVLTVKCWHIDLAPTSYIIRDCWKVDYEVEISAPMGTYLLLENLSMEEEE